MEYRVGIDLGGTNVAVGVVDELLGIALGADVDGDDVFVPHDAHVSPADGHGVEAGGVAGGEQGPVLPDEGEGVQGQGGGIDGMKGHKETSLKESFLLLYHNFT